ncbi:MaoC family dehydratase N-terminal domain-containing protein [Chloroflexota bacterium]
MPKELPEEIKKMIGITSVEPVVYEVERGAIRQYAEAVGDNNPIYWDLDYVKGIGRADLAVPPGFFGEVTSRHFTPPGTEASDPLFGVITKVREALGLRAVLNGGNTYESFAPICPGDRLFSYVRTKDIFIREGKLGTMGFVLMENRYINQNDELVATDTLTFILT